MDREKMQKISRTLLRFSAAVFGLVTILECGVLAWEAFRPALFRAKAMLEGAKPLTAIGGSNGSTVIYMTAKTPLAILLPLLYLLPPILTAVFLVILHRHKRMTSAAKTKNGRGY